MSNWSISNIISSVRNTVFTDNDSDTKQDTKQDIEQDAVMVTNEDTEPNDNIMTDDVKEGDEICDIENIIGHEEVEEDGKKKMTYHIKWVGKKRTSWINEEDFITKDILNEYKEYIKNRETANGKRAYIYCRTSKRNRDKEVSLYDQEEKCLKYAKDNGFSVIGLFKDNGISAKKMSNQSGLKYIKELIKQGEYILFYDVSRFSRSVIDGIQYLEDLREKHGVIAHSVNENITWDNVGVNRARFRDALSQSQLHSETVTEKIKNSFEVRKKRGDHIGKAPYGYKTKMIDGIRRLVRNEEEIKVIELMLEKLVDVTAERFTGLKLDGGVRKRRRDNALKYLRYLSQSDYQKIANEINVTHKNRGKRFTWTIVRSIITKWQDYM